MGRHAKDMVVQRCFDGLTSNGVGLISLPIARMSTGSFGMNLSGRQRIVSPRRRLHSTCPSSSWSVLFCIAGKRCYGVTECIVLLDCWVGTAFRWRIFCIPIARIWYKNVFLLSNSPLFPDSVSLRNTQPLHLMG